MMQTSTHQPPPVMNKRVLWQRIDGLPVAQQESNYGSRREAGAPNFGCKL